MATDHHGQGRVVRNTTANALLFGIQLATTLVSFPYVLHHFGRSTYGVYSVVLGLQLFLQVLALGIGSSVMRFVPAAREDARLMQSLLDNSYFIALVGNTAIALVLLGLAAVSAPVLGISGTQTRLYFDLTVPIAVFTVINGILAVPRGVLAGFERFGQRTKLELFGAAGPLFGIALIKFGGFGLTAYVAFTQGAVAISGLLIALACMKLLPRTRHRAHLHRDEIRGLLGFNVLLTGNQLADLVFYTSDRLVLQRAVGAAAVADYSVVERPNILAQAVLSLPLTAVIPAAARAHALGDDVRLDVLTQAGSRVYTALVLPPLLLLTVLMKGFLRHWVGASFDNLAPSGELFVLALAVTTPAKVVSHILLAMGRQRPMVLSKLCYAPVNLGLSIALALRYGIVGVVIPTFLYFAIVYPVVIAHMMSAAGISPWRLARGVAPAVGASIAGAAITGASDSVFAPASFLGFAALGFAGLTLSYFAAIFLGLLREDRLRLISSLPVRFQSLGRRLLLT
jgi:O-antigen/teichoic acid export membrane protein